MAINIKFYRISERKPKHEDSIIWLKESSFHSSLYGFNPRKAIVEYVWEEIDPVTGALTGNGTCYSKNDNPADFINHRLMIMFDDVYAQDDDLWCPVEEYWESFNNEQDYEQPAASPTIESLVEEVKELYFNKLCFRYDGTIARCIGAAEDPDDYYYVMRKLGGEIVYDSAVIVPILLDRTKDYDLIEQHMNRNQCQPNESIFISTL